MNQFIEEKLPRVAAWAIPLIVLLTILILRPHWGLMDDVTNTFELIPRIREHGVFRYGWMYGINDLAWGMFRPTYPPMVYLVYAPGMATAPWVTFVWNALLVMAAIFFYCAVLSRIVGISLPLLVVGCGAFFYGHDLFQHPSLQEKMLLFAGAGLTWHFWNRSRWSSVAFWIVAFLWLAFGACVKASFAIHYCVAFMAFVATNADALKRKNMRAWCETLVLAILGIVLVLGFAYISKHGGYTSHYSKANIIPNLKSIQGPFFLLPISAAVAWLVWHWRAVYARPELLLPLVGVSAFVTLFAAWGIGGYVQSVIVPLYAALILQLCVWYLPQWARAAWIPALVVVSLAVTGYRSLVNFGRLHDVGAVVAHAAELEAAGATELWMPCEEGSLSMHRFFQSHGNKVTVTQIAPDGPTRGKTIFYDQSMCPFNGRVAVPADCQQPETLVRGLFSKSYHVVRCH